MSEIPNLTRRQRARELGIAPGTFTPGPHNALSDVAGVLVGHMTLIEGDDVRTGATAILPHGGNLFQDKVPAGVVVGNGYGKLMGSTQLAELGEIETPILLTNTLAVPRAADAILDWTLAQPGNEKVFSINPIVGETNDCYLNDIRRRTLTPELIYSAIENAAPGPIAEGAVGAGTGTIAFSWKGGIGTSSRAVTLQTETYIVGVLVQSNYGGDLQILGVPVGRQLGDPRQQQYLDPRREDGSIMIVVATDAPLSDRNLTRLARRALAGLARTGSSFSNGSGDYVLAFSTAEGVRRTPEKRARPSRYLEISNDLVSPLLQAVIETTEEAIYNSLCMATTTRGYRGHVALALPLDRTVEILQKHRQLE